MKLINIKISHIFKGKELIVSEDISETRKIMLDENGVVELADDKAKILLADDPNWQEFASPKKVADSKEQVIPEPEETPEPEQQIPAQNEPDAIPEPEQNSAEEENPEAIVKEETSIPRRRRNR